jgi:lipid-A-disaccharide synthase-like uncharacterized protein
MISIFKIIGSLGLLLITIGILLKNRKIRDILYVVGGLSLEVYSIFIGDLIFIILQAVFTMVAVYDLIKLRR